MNDSQDLFIDESMIKNINEYNSIKDEITCEICQGILLNPKQCESCETIFCEKCINNWISKNNSCPYRCNKFILKECPKLMKKILDKLIIECPLCKNEFKYEPFVKKHFDECAEEKKMVKCPLCSDCQIKYKTLKEYNNKLIQEKNELLKEIEIYKKKINQFENNNKVSFKWAKIQKNNLFQLFNFQLSNDDKTIRINYNGCYQIYFIDNIFTNNLEYSFGVHINTLGKIYNYMAIGFINENFNNDCLCCKPGNTFYLRVDEEAIYSNKNKISTKLDNKTDISLKFNLNMNNNKLEIKEYNTNKIYGIIDVIGKQFKFFVSKCNYGYIEYTILP